ncbi:MAG: ABC transporter ATP-binding protein [Pseudomonadota bacterium]
MTDLLNVTGLNKSFGTKSAVSSTSLAVEPGTIVALLGANGAGKSTTIKILAGLDEADSGRITLTGRDVSEDAFARRVSTSYLPEQVALYDELSGRANLRHLLDIATQKVWRPDELEAPLSASGLAREAWDKPVGSYSKGMRQKVGLALALAREARLLLLDEPTSGLDPYAAAELGRALTEFTGAGGGVLMATHDVYRAAEIATTILIMAKGRVITAIDPRSASPRSIEAQFFDEVGGALQSEEAC